MTVLVMILFFIGIILALIGYLWQIGLAFIEHILWGLAYLFLPFAGLVFVIVFWKKKSVRRATFMYLVGWGLTLIGLSMSSAGISQLFLQSALNSDDWKMSREQQSFPVPSGGEMSRDISQQDGYINYMKAGYNAYKQEDFQTALINFNRAVGERPEDYYAVTAVKNTQLVITHRKFVQQMNLGYDAVERREYENALIYFQQANGIRPGNPYAVKAIKNTQEYLNRSR